MGEGVMMEMATIVSFPEVSGGPSARISTPSLLRIGDRLRLAFRLKRQNGGRTEMLDVSGEWRVSEIAVDLTGATPRQVISVTSVKAAPSWKAVRKTPPWVRRIPPARAPRTIVE